MTGTNYKCHICGQEFKAIDGYLSHLNKQHQIDLNEFIKSNTQYDFKEALCPICGNLRKFNKRGNQFSSKTCGNNDCILKQIQLSNTQDVKIARQIKIKQTMTKRYGATSYTMTQEFKNKASKTKLNKYGNKYYRGKIKNYCQYTLWDMITTWNEYIVPLFDRSEYKGLGESYKWKCQLCGQEFESTIHSTRHIEGHQYDRMPRCFNCFPRKHGTSQQEIEFIQFCKSYFPNLLSNDKSLIRRELDIVIPELKLAIEYNGIYWHSLKNPKVKQGQHLLKTTLCEEVGFRLIHVWEDEWCNNQELLKRNLTAIFTSTEVIPSQDKYNRFWFSPLQFNKVLSILPPTIEQRIFNDKSYYIENCGYFTIPPLQ